MRILITGVVAAAIALGTGAANAAQPTYVSKWGKDARFSCPT